MPLEMMVSPCHRVDLMLLKHKPDSCLWELPKREELSIRRWHHCATHGNQLGVFQDEVRMGLGAQHQMGPTWTWCSWKGDRRQRRESNRKER